MNFIFDLDYKIIEFLQNNGPNEVLDPFIVFITKIGDSGFIWFLIIGILLLFKKQRKVGIVSFLSLGMVSVLGEFILKNLVQRERPFRVIEGINLIVEAPTDFSFPSMHAGSSFAVACVLLFYWHWKASPLMALAIGIAASRAYLFVHFPSDTIVGAVLGIMTACICIAFDQVVNIDAILDKIYAKFGKNNKKLEDSNEEENQENEENQNHKEENFDDNDVAFESNEEFDVSFDTGKFDMNFDTAEFKFDTSQFNFDELEDFEYINPNPSRINTNVQTSTMGKQVPMQRQQTPMSRQSVSQQIQTNSVSRLATESVNQMSQVPMQTTAPVQRQFTAPVQRQTASIQGQPNDMVQRQMRTMQRQATAPVPRQMSQVSRQPEVQESMNNEVQQSVAKQELLHENEMPKRVVRKKVQKPVKQPIMKQKPVTPTLPQKAQKSSIEEEEDDFMAFYNKRKEEKDDDFDFDFRI